jgi:hypothetical protein
MHRTTLTAVALVLGLIAAPGKPASAHQLMTKPQVANLIKNVEDGVDDFRDYLKKRGENGREAAAASASSGRRTRQATDDQRARGKAKADELDDALGDLNKSTNRLRRKFDVTDTWMETKNLVEKMVDDARKINPIVARGNYGTESAKLWGVLRKGINDLARAYGVPPDADLTDESESRIGRSVPSAASSRTRRRPTVPLFRAESRLSPARSGGTPSAARPGSPLRLRGSPRSCRRPPPHRRRRQWPRHSLLRRCRQ